jgi:hypothetical protein
MLELLAEVAERVRSGKVNGLLISIKQGERHHGIGLLGDYLDDPAQVPAVTARIDYRCNQLVDERLRKKTGGKVVPFGDER